MKLNLGLSILGAIVAIGMTLVTSGCSGGGGGGGGNLAPTSLNSRSLTFQDPDIPGTFTTYTFTATNYTSPGGDSGTYTYARSATVNQATLQLNSIAATVLHYTLTYTSTAGGTYLDTDTAKTSTFTAP